MEVRVEALDASLPEGCFIAVRVGDVQKQTLYDPRKLYRFPKAKRYGKVEVLKRIGTCDLVWNADEPETRTCKAIDSKSGTGIRLRLSMARSGANHTGQGCPNSFDAGGVHSSSDPANPFCKTTSSEREAKTLANKYLEKHGVETLLTAAMRALLKTMPPDAAAFLCDYIQSQCKPRAQATEEATEDANLVPSHEAHSLTEAEECLPTVQEAHNGAVQHALEPGRETSDGTDLEDLRTRASQALIAALETGTLSQAVESSMQSLQLDPLPDNLLRRETVQSSVGLSPTHELRTGAAEPLRTEVCSSAPETAVVVAGKDHAAEDSREDQLRAPVAAGAHAGGLKVALVDAPLQKQAGDPKQERLEDLRTKIGNALIISAKNGSLEKAMRSSKCHREGPSTTQVHVSDLRGRIAQGLIAGAKNGSLSQSMMALKGGQRVANPETFDAMRGTPAESLIFGASVQEAFNQPAERESLTAPGSVSEQREATIDESSLADSRTNSCRALIAALENGALIDAIEEASRAKAAEALIAGAFNGTLEAAIVDACGDSQVEPICEEQLRKSDADPTLVGASDETLKVAITIAQKQTQALDPRHQRLKTLRTRIGDSLLMSAKNGTLETALQSSKCYENGASMTHINLDELRSRVAQGLIAAANDGRLNQSLNSARGGQQAAGAKPYNFDEVRETLADDSIPGAECRTAEELQE